MPSILLLPIGTVPEGLLASLHAPLEQAFGVPVRTEDRFVLDPAPAFDESRNQYFSTRLITSILQRFTSPDGKILGVSASDLFVPVLTYVFGEAQLDGPVAVVSTYRLDDRLYGLPANLPLLEQRLIKEAVHELGHTFGLIHCRDQDCVMHSSSAVEEIDLKPALFCSRCRSVLPVGGRQ